MFEAQLLQGTTSVFSPWFPRGGDNVVLTVDLVALSGAGSITVELFTKNSEQSGEGVDSDSTNSTKITQSAVGRGSTTWVTPASGNVEILELVRYKFTSGEGASDWVLFRMLSPVWFDDVKA